MIEKSKKHPIRSMSIVMKKKVIIPTVIAVAFVVAASGTISVLRKTVVVNIDGTEQVLVTYTKTIEEVLNENGIKLAPKDKISPALSKELLEGDTITIEKAVGVSIATADKTIEIQTTEDTVEEMLESEKEYLKSNGIEFVNGIDEISPSLSTEIKDNLDVKVVKVERSEEVAYEAIAYDVFTEEDSEMEIDTQEVRQYGVEGEKELTYEIIKKDGKEVSREMVSSEIITEPVNEVIAQGTKEIIIEEPVEIAEAEVTSEVTSEVAEAEVIAEVAEVIESEEVIETETEETEQYEEVTEVASRGDESSEYKELLYCESTAYALDGITATGTVPVYNPGGLSTIAVDPRVIPLGSLVYVEGYGKAVAEDTGGAIVGNKIDVYLNSNDAAYAWGRKFNIPVYVLAYPGEW